MKLNHLLFLLIFIISCSTQKADLIVHHAHIYSIDSAFSIYEAMAIKDGKILDIGSNESIQKKYSSDSTIDAKGQYIYPGLIDAHCHFYWYGIGLQSADLVGTTSFNDVIARLKSFEKDNPNKDWIIGRGWDQNDWDHKEYPSIKILSDSFPNKKIVLKRIDGHALIASESVMKLLPNGYQNIEGGKYISSAGVFIDNAMTQIESLIPKPSKEDNEKALLDAQKKCFEVGLTSICDAGLERDIIETITNLNDLKSLKMRIYAMISTNKENLEYYIDKTKIKTDFLNVRSFKLYADGALGSRGACLLEHYSDKPKETGFLLQTIDELDHTIGKLISKGWQVNTHCIGDSANRTLLNLYAKHLKIKNDKRCRIEHAQIVAPSDLSFFGKYSIIPSVQATHATSDMYWADERLGEHRIATAYTYKSLKNQLGFIANGTDFPIENINPLFTFYAAVARKDGKGFPEDGFQIEEALTREDALRSMTIWAAYAQFEEKEKGSLEKGKFADFIIMREDLMKEDLIKIRNTKIIGTFVGGKKVF